MFSKNQIDQEDSQKYQTVEYKVLLSCKLKRTYISFAFNTASTLFFTGERSGKIKIYGFNTQKKLITILKHHKRQVNCLIFMMKHNELVSGDQYGIIKIWNQKSKNVWSPYSKLDGNINSIYNIIANKNEDLLISGGSDLLMQFWKKQNYNWNCLQTLDVHTETVYMSLNTSENILIACGSYYDIVVIESNIDQKWFISQMIPYDYPISHYNLRFINDNQFLFQTRSQDFFEIFNYDDEMKLFTLSKQINYCIDKNYIPSQFIIQKNSLIVKFGFYLNLFAQDQQGDFILQQVIQLGEKSFYARITENGKFIVTMQENQNQYQLYVWNQY